MVSLLAALDCIQPDCAVSRIWTFLLAKRGGICVVEFSLGMGPGLFSFVKAGRGTR